MAEGGGLLNRYTLQRRIEGSNPSVSARLKLRFRITAAAVAWKLIRGRPAAAGFNGGMVRVDGAGGIQKEKWAHFSIGG